MLILSRTVGERVLIGDNVYVTVVEVDRGKVRLGFDAPRDVPIYRTELLPLVPAQRPNVADNARPAAG